MQVQVNGSISLFHLFQNVSSDWQTNPEGAGTPSWERAHPPLQKPLNQYHVH